MEAEGAIPNECGEGLPSFGIEYYSMSEKVHVFVLGESSRVDHFAYAKP